MTVYCWRCGTPSPESASFCAHCGAALLTATSPVSPAGADTDAPPGFETDVPDFVYSDVPPTRPAVQTPPDEADVPSPVWGPPAYAPTPSGTSSGRGRGLMIGVLVVVLVAAVATVVAILGPRVGRPGGVTSPSTQSAQAPQAQPPVPTPQPSALTPPAGSPGLPRLPDYAPSDCGTTQAGAHDSFVLGSDRIPTPIAIWLLGTVSMCRKDTATSIDVTYGTPVDQWTYLRDDYTLRLQQDDALTAGPMAEDGGYFWGRSLDAGQWLVVGFFSDPAYGVTVSLRKGGRDIVPDGLVEAVSSEPETVADPREPGTGDLTVTPLAGWDHYDLSWFYGHPWTPIGNRYNKIVDGNLVGTLALTAQKLYSTGGPLELADAAHSLLLTVGDRLPGAAWVAAVDTTVDGCPALQYTFTVADTTIRYVFVQGPRMQFMFAAEVDTADPGLLDEVQAMIDSSIVSP